MWYRNAKSSSNLSKQQYFCINYSIILELHQILISTEIVSAAEPVRKISTDQVKSILKKPRESTPETTMVSSAAISLRRGEFH